MIKNFVFDIANVLLNFKPLEYLKEKLGNDEIAEKMLKEIFLDKDFKIICTGKVTQKEAFKKIYLKNEKDRNIIKYIYDNWYEIFTPIEDSIEILKKLKTSGYGTYYLSNFQLLPFKYVHKKFNFFKLFDGGTISCKEQILKPDKGIYMRLIERYNILPEESIYIDDSQKNIDTAKKLGFKTILFTDASELKRSILNYDL